MKIEGMNLPDQWKNASATTEHKLLFILYHSRSTKNGEWAEFQLAAKKRLYDLIAYAEYAVKYTETLIIPEVEIQFMFSRFLVQLLCWKFFWFYPPVF